MPLTTTDERRPTDQSIMGILSTIIAIIGVAKCSGYEKVSITVYRSQERKNGRISITQSQLNGDGHLAVDEVINKD